MSKMDYTDKLYNDAFLVLSSRAQSRDLMDLFQDPSASLGMTAEALDSW
jgi:hypothetical protein